MALRVDVIIPTYNNLKNLKNCLDGFRNQSFSNFRIIVCIDGSTDGTNEWLQKTLYTFRLSSCEHPDKQNHGRNATRNLALPLLDSEIIVFLDSDMTIGPHFISDHLEISGDKQTVSVGKVTYVNKITNMWGAYLETRGAGKFAHGDRIPYTYFVTGNASIPTRVFHELDGQDAQMRTYGGGDTEFAIRMHKNHNLRLRYNEKAVASSKMDKSLRFALDQMREFGSVNLPHILNKHPEHDDLFRMNELLGQSTKSKVMRLVLSLPLHFPEWILKIKPDFARNKLIAWLVMKNIYAGFKSAKMKK